MRRVMYGLLFFLAGVLMPVLIWVALFVAVREQLVYAMKRSVYAVLFFLTGVFMPVLIWVGFFVAIKQWARERVPRRKAERTIGEILSAARLTIQWAPGGKQLALTVFGRRPMSEIEELLARTKL